MVSRCYMSVLVIILMIFFVDRVFTVIFKGFYLVGLTGRKLTENAIMV